MTLAAHPVFTTELRGTTLIEASAGTGKTWTLSGLYVRALVESNLRVEQIAVVTFTRAAASELRKKIHDRVGTTLQVLEGRPSDDPFIRMWVDKLAPGKRQEAILCLRLAYASSDQMVVSTIHSFCHRLLVAGFGTQAVFDDVQLLTSQRELFVQVRDEFFIELFAQKVAGTKDHRDSLAAWFVQDGKQTFVEKKETNFAPHQLLKLNRALQHPYLIGVLDGKDNPTKLQLDNLIETLITDLVVSREALSKLTFEQLTDWILITSKAPGFKAASLNTKSREKYPAELLAAFLSPQLKLSQAICEKLQRLAWDWEKLGLTRERRPVHPVGDAAWNYLQAIGRSPQLSGAIGLAFRQFALPRLKQLKLQANAVMQDDLIADLHQSLVVNDSAGEVARSLAELFPLALVDETQDTDAQTWETLFAIYQKTGGLVAVGDPKQTIYRFRGADVHAYLAARERCEAVRVLSQNQRSLPQLVEAVNTLFAVDKSFILDGITFTPADASSKAIPKVIETLDTNTADAPVVLPPMVIHFGEPAEIGKSGALTKESMTRFAGQWAVDSVRYWLRQRFELNGAVSDVVASDIAILVDSNHQAQLIRTVLNRAGIAAVETSQALVTQSDEASELAEILHAIAQPSDRALVLKAMTSRLWGAQEHTIKRVRAEALLYESVRALLRQTQSEWTRFGAGFALTSLFAHLNTVERLGLLQSGERRIANVKHLVELIALAQPALSSAVTALHWLQSLRAVAENGGTASIEQELLEIRLESDAQLVRVMTVHKCKGLEFPIVLMPFASFGREVDPSKDWPFLDHDPSCLRFDTPPTQTAAQHSQSDAQGENARKLYVALTRAKSLCSVLLLDVGKNLLSSAWHALIAKHAARDYNEQHALIQQWSQESTSFRCMQYPLRDGIEEALEPNRGAPLASKVTSFVASPVRSKRLRATWANTSFTALANQVNQSVDSSVPEFFDRDHDAFADRSADYSPLLQTSSAVEQYRHQFARGEVAGQFLHAVFEKTQFSQGVQTQLLDELARKFGIDIDAKLTSSWLNQVLHHPIEVIQSGDTLNTKPVVLATLEPKVIRRELEFMQSLHRSEYLTDVFSRLKISQPVGFLRGFIDLVFECNGRCYVLDWKSNYLGSSADDYDQMALQHAMEQHQYDLQAKIYSAAVVQWLKARLQQNYDPAWHFGGVIYLFIRGVGIDISRPNLGVYFSRPEGIG